jgi:hypothetical protein
VLRVRVGSKEGDIRNQPVSLSRSLNSMDGSGEEGELVTVNGEHLVFLFSGRRPHHQPEGAGKLLNLGGSQVTSNLCVLPVPVLCLLTPSSSTSIHGNLSGERESESVICVEFIELQAIPGNPPSSST